MSQYRVNRPPDAAPAILLGYGNLAEAAIEVGVQTIARIVTASVSSRR